MVSAIWRRKKLARLVGPEGLDVSDGLIALAPGDWFGEPTKKLGGVAIRFEDRSRAFPPLHNDLRRLRRTERVWPSILDFRMP